MDIDITGDADQYLEMTEAYPEAIFYRKGKLPSHPMLTPPADPLEVRDLGPLSAIPSKEIKEIFESEDFLDILFRLVVKFQHPLGISRPAWALGMYGSQYDDFGNVLSKTTKRFTDYLAALKKYDVGKYNEIYGHIQILTEGKDVYDYLMFGNRNNSASAAIGCIINSKAESLRILDELLRNMRDEVEAENACRAIPSFPVPFPRISSPGVEIR